MKKRITTLIALTLAFISVEAQTEDFFYIDFVPDSCKYVTEASPFEIDITSDGQIDLWFSGYRQHGALLMTTHVSQGWEYCKPYPEENTVLNADTLLWKQTTDDWFGSGSFMGRIGLRRCLSGQYCYGWMQVYCDTVPTQPYPGVVGRNTYVDKMAYCTIPNYPLQWGQTTLTGIEENNESNSFATLYPNPTKSQVTIRGENLRKAEVVNMLGQQVSKVQGEGETLRIDIANLPAGVYFVNVTDEEGRKCVRKMMKE